MHFGVCMDKGGMLWIKYVRYNNDNKKNLMVVIDSPLLQEAACFIKFGAK